jgi:hypothetical protein
LYIRFQTNLLFGSLSQRLGPNHPKLCFVLPILKYEQTSNFKVATHRP